MLEIFERASPLAIVCTIIFVTLLGMRSLCPILIEFALNIPLIMTNCSVSVS